MMQLLSVVCLSLAVKVPRSRRLLLRDALAEVARAAQMACLSTSDGVRHYERGLAGSSSSSSQWRGLFFLFLNQLLGTDDEMIRLYKLISRSICVTRPWK